MKLLLSFFMLLSIGIIQAGNPSAEYLNDAVYVAEVKSFSTDGFLNCEFQCYLDMNYSNFEEAPIMYFQLGTVYNPTEYHNLALDEESMQTTIIDKSFHANNYKIQLNFGKIAVQKDFVARIAVVHNDEVNYINLSPTDFNNSIIIMDIQKDSEERGLCKAEQFLRKIDFDRLYREYSYVAE